VLIATEAIGVGGVDVLIRSGALAAYGFTPGHILGGEVAGTVAAVGADVEASWVGRRVWAFTGLGGGYVERALAPAATLVALPDALPASAAVTLGSSGVVAHFGLRHAHFTAGESVLVRGAAGGIGVMAVQLARRAGASAVAVTTSSPERGERLKALGATEVCDRSGGDGSYDVILDIVAGPDMPSFLPRLNANGRYVALGAVAGPPPTAFLSDLFAAFQRSLSFATFSANTVPEDARRAYTAELFTAGLQAVVHEVLPLEEAVRAHQLMDAGGVVGRIVLTPS
jgi:NADPH:quinone reductase-like Zn-dependent oxidoreductase